MRAWALIGILLVSLNLRAAVTSLSAIYNVVGKDIHGLNISILGTLPLLSFALFGSLTSTLSKRLGFERSLILAMLLTAMGIGLRSISSSFPVFAICSVIALAGMGLSNVLMPPIIKRYFPDHIGGMTAVYSVMIAVSAGLPSAIAVPLTEWIGWRGNVGFWGGTALLAALPWCAIALKTRLHPRRHPALAENPHATPSVSHAQKDTSLAEALPQRRVVAVYKWPVAWSMVVLFGVTMMSMYAMLTWLPAYLVAQGMSSATAGNILFVYNIVGVLHSILVPLYLNRMKHPYLVVVAAGALQIIGYAGFLFLPAGAWVWAVVAAPGLMTVPATFDLINLRTRTSAGAASLSTFVQAAGYVLAALGPFVVGKLAASAGGWSAAFGFLSVAAIIMMIVGKAAMHHAYLEDAGPANK